MEPIILNITTPKDQNDGNLADGLSLREALLEANANPREQYIINLPAGEYRLDLKNTLDAPIVDVTSIDQETLIEQRKTTGDLDLIGNVTLIGEDPENTIIDAFDLRTNFEARLSSLPIAPLEGGEFDLIPGLESKLISVTVEGVPRSDSPRPIGKTAEFSTSIFTIGDRIFDVENGSTLNIENVTVKNGFLVTTKEVILDLVDEDPLDQDPVDPDPENGQRGEIYTRTYTIPGVDFEGNPIDREVIEQYRLKDVITELDIEAGGTISTGNIDTTPEGAGIKMGVGSNVNLENVILEENGTETVAGAIYNDGTLNINQSTIQNNSAVISAGGIHNNNVLTVNRSTIQDNASGLGTGIHNVDRAEVYNSLIANNSAGSNFLRTTLGIERFVFPIGAGIFNESSANLVVVNSTIYGNEGGVDLGGGILSEGKADIVNSTIIENIGQGGAGIWANTTTADVTLYNTIVAQNRKPNFNYYGDLQGIFYNVPDVEGFINPNSSNNYLGYANGVLVDGVNGNIARTNISETEQHIDIGLGELQNNGGNTLTVSIDGDSLFVDAGSNTIFGELVEGIGLGDYYPTFNLINDQPTDQRFTETTDGENIIRTGFQRIANGTVDLGAFEYKSEEIQQVIDPTEPTDPTDPTDPDDIERDNHPLDGDEVSNQTSDSNSGNNNNSESPTTDSTSDPNNQNSDTNTSNENVDIPDFSGDVNNSTTENSLSALDMALFRFQNTDRLGTYLYANAEESLTIEANYPNFNNEGFAFRVGMSEGDNLIAFYRFHNNNVPGTYLYANATERLDILANYQNFEEEGLAFYAYDGNADIADDVYRLQNLNQPGTYLFVDAQEKDNILANFDNYISEGVAFEASFTQL